MTLEFWRFIACMQIAYFHARINNTYNHKGYLWADFFFILSGFVFINKSSNLTLFEFFKSRFKRIMPLLCISLILLFLIFYFKNIIPTYAQSSFLLLFYQFTLLNSTILQKVAEGEWNYPTWALSAEFIASILVFTIKNRLNVFIKILISIFIYWMILHELNSLDSYNHVYFWILTTGILRAIAGIFLGMSLKSLSDKFEFQNKVLMSFMEVAIFVIQLIILFSAKPASMIYDYFFVLTSICLIFIYSKQKGAVSQIILKMGLGKLGLISFAVFCLHVPVLNFLYFVLYTSQQDLIFLFPMTLIAVSVTFTKLNEVISKKLSK